MALAGCTIAEPEPLELPTPPPNTELTVSITVIDDGSGARLCASVMTSLPPQCGAGMPIDGWSWEGLAGVEEQDGVRWGEYSLVGEYDGERLTLTREPGASIDGVPDEPPPPSGLSQNELNHILMELRDELPGWYSSGLSADSVGFAVFWDDGSLQGAMDRRYGIGAVDVSSLFRAAD